jgi:hypothetical protein
MTPPPRFAPVRDAGAGVGQYLTSSEGPVFELLARQGTAFTVNAGGGIKVRIGDNWGFRTDARLVNVLARDAGDYGRLYNGVTFRFGR